MSGRMKFMLLHWKALAAFLGEPAGGAGVKILRSMLQGSCAEGSDEQYVWYEYRSLGISFMFRDLASGPRCGLEGAKALSAVHLYSEGYEGYAEYAGALPGEVRFGATKKELRDTLGDPRRVGGGGYSEFLGKPVPEWLKYVCDGRCVHMQLDDRRCLQLVTLMYDPEC